MEEERRLMYVAMTRARHHLAVLYPLNSYGSRWGSEYTIDQLSRFIDVGVRERMRRMAAYPAPAAGARAGAAARHAARSSRATSRALRRSLKPRTRASRRTDPSDATARAR